MEAEALKAVATGQRFPAGGTSGGLEFGGLDEAAAERQIELGGLGQLLDSVCHRGVAR